MTHDDLILTVRYLRPGAQFGLRGEDLSGLEWHGPGEPPTAAEVEAARDGALTARAWLEVRVKRDRLLAASDWTQVADAPVDQQAWAVYRQTLRDIPQDYATPDAVVWPDAPA